MENNGLDATPPLFKIASQVSRKGGTVGDESPGLTS